MENTPEQIQFPNLALEINKMVETDQDMRENNLKDDSWDDELDKKNTERIKEIIIDIGWPTVSKVGKSASVGAWLLVQHADHDVDFQLHCLDLMRKLPNGEVRPEDIALLTDRVRVNRGQPQLYGTQFRQIDGKHVPKDIEDIEHVDERRAEMGLDTLMENIARINSKYPLK